MNRFCRGFAALFLCMFLAPAAQGAMLQYTVTASFDGDHVFELGSPDDSVCYYTDSCYPDTFRLPAISGGLFSHLELGDTVTASFAFDPESDVGGPCTIAGWSECGDFMGVYSSAPPSSDIAAEWYDSSVVSSVILDLFKDKISYEGEAGSYMMSGCSMSAPLYDGLPATFCDFFGYGADFTVLDYEVSKLAAVPTPFSLPLLVAALGGMAGYGRFRRGAQA